MLSIVWLLVWPFIVTILIMLGIKLCCKPARFVSFTHLCPPQPPQPPQTAARFVILSQVLCPPRHLTTCTPTHPTPSVSPSRVCWSTTSMTLPAKPARSACTWSRSHSSAQCNSRQTAALSTRCGHARWWPKFLQHSSDLVPEQWAWAAACMQLSAGVYLASLFPALSKHLRPCAPSRFVLPPCRARFNPTNRISTCMVSAAGWHLRISLVLCLAGCGVRASELTKPATQQLMFTQQALTLNS